MAKRSLICVMLVAFCLFATAPLLAQVVTSGRLTGVVQDQTGAVIAGADIKVRDEATGVVFETKSSADGTFAVGNLKPGTYVVTVSMQGFKSAEFRAVKIITGQIYDLVAKMEVGAVESTVVVEAGAEVLETASTTVASTITGKSLTQLPFTSRDALDLAILMPGASTTGRVRQTSFMGLPKGAINITYDGINAQDNILKSSDGFFTTIRPRVDSIEEFSITTAAAGSDKSSEGAVQINFETKRGTNAYHGGVWWYHRNDFLNANYWFTNSGGPGQTPLERQRMRLNQFGYKIGGPIWKDKIYFFHAYDIYKKPDSVFRTRTILTNEAAAGTLRYAVVGSIAAGVTIPNWVNCGPGAGPGTVLAAAVPAGTQCTAALIGTPPAGTPTTWAASVTGGPFTNAIDSTVGSIISAVQSSANVAGAGTSPGTSLWTQLLNFSNSSNSKRLFPDFRFDYDVTKKHQVWFIYHFGNFIGSPDTLNGRDPTFPVAPFNTNIASQNSNRNQFTWGWRWNLTSTMSNSVVFGVVSAPVWFFNDQQTTIYPSFTTNLGTINIRPLMNIITQPFLPFGAQPRNTALGQLTDNFSWSKGKHNISFGFNMTHLRGGINFNSAAVASVGLGLNANDPAAARVSAANFPGSDSTIRGAISGLYGMLAGRVTSYSGSVFLDVNARQFVTGSSLQERYRQTEFGFFVSDNWRVRPTVTITAGLRWEYQGSPYDMLNEYFEVPGGQAAAFGVSGNNNLFNPGVMTGAIPGPYRLHGGGAWWDAPLNNFAPSMGVAWQPNWDNRIWNSIFGGPGKTVFRVGFGTNFTREGTNNWLSIVESNPGRSGSQFTNASNPALPPDPVNGFFPAGTVQLQSGTISGVAQIPAAFSDTVIINPAAGHSTNSYSDNFSVPTVYSWQVGIQRELTPNMVVEVRYVGNTGNRLYTQVNLNEVNIHENGFLTEFGRAKANLAINGGTSFANLNPGGGTQPLPIMTAAFTGTANVATGGSTGQGNSFFSNGTFISQLNNNTPGAMANSIWGTFSLACNLIGSAAFQGALAASPCPSTAPVTGLFPANFFVVNPNARGGGWLFKNDGHSTYHGLQIEVRRRMSAGVQFNANYSFSKALTNIQADSSTGGHGFTSIRDTQAYYNKGPSPWDLTHQFKMQAIWELPFGPGRKWSNSHSVINRMIEGWEISGITRWQSGRIFRITSGLGGTFNQNDPGIILAGITPNQLQNALSIRKVTGSSAGQVFWFPDSLLTISGSQVRANSTFIKPCQNAGQLCNRVFLTGPSFFRQDINVVKRTKITEKVNFEFRAEFLNAFNNINFFFPGSETSSVDSLSTQSTAFGRVTSAYRDLSTTDDPGGRIVQIVLRINF